MLTKIIRNKKKTSRFITWKLKKKWSFWRVFKFYFLRRKNFFFFFKTRWLFNQKRIIWHQWSVIYGKKIKNKAYTNHKSRIIFNSRLNTILCKLELRLNILLIRMRFVNKLLRANSIIFNQQIIVNSTFKHHKYIVCAGDLVRYIQNRKNMLCFINRRRWIKYEWRQWRKRKKIINKSNKTKFKQNFFLLKKNFIFNFMEINYRFFSGILLRRPLLGEISFRNKKQLLTLKLFQKIYFLY